jgi:hypothetical protein
MLLSILNSFHASVSLAIEMCQILFAQLKRKGLIHDIVWVEIVGGADDWWGKEGESIDDGGGGNIAVGA